MENFHVISIPVPLVMVINIVITSVAYDNTLITLVNST
jgi:hypothetical protein